MSKLLFAMIAAIAVAGTAVLFYENNKQSGRFLTAKTQDVPDHIKTNWTLWKQENNKAYGTNSEDEERMNIFYYNSKVVLEHNNKQDNYRLSLNKYADLTSVEFKAQYLGLKHTTKTRESAKKVDTSSLKSSVNWVNAGKVTGVKDQGQCGSCWAFSTTGSSEGANAIKNGELKSFSEQQLVDCAGGEYYNQGCRGGLMDNAFKYIKAFGLQSESSYRYTARDGTCRYNKSDVEFNLTGYTDVDQNDSSLAEALNSGPVSVAINANPLQLYNSGIFSDWSCGAQLDHGVLAVGYDSENGKDYFLVKNSWGASWGEQGYFRFARRSYGIGMCGITQSASYPASA